MISSCRLSLAALLLSVAASTAATAQKADEFPFGLEMTLDVAPQAGSKRLPTLEIGDKGEVLLELWCKATRGQFSVAGNSIIFLAGVQDNRSCTPAQIATDDVLVAAMSQVTSWKRQGDVVSFQGPQSLRFRLNTN